MIKLGLFTIFLICSLVGSVLLVLLLLKNALRTIDASQIDPPPINPENRDEK